ncbi:6-phospho-beta-glucosidase [Lactobacillus jensenii]|uniref:glycoside hydrolase family 1 protein n=1 Tax=Lactobacillus jensenii TaxID=109790 RepID=UPI000C7AEEE1|nr:glycoside hydrolase family 1 protein [Lactobacillus jensenii]MCF1828380.1 glycoside hydrolase family 1 protein [Lactobacillus jensenii]MDK8130827.1 glycoside hydrolase family 1 protein [Lactobacillus jensenii]PLA47935.1 6-phospho-beta-glucosidase [Lactobacillus jensenii]
MEKFFWGNSTSSMQTEGGWNEDGKSKSVYDIRTATESSSDWKVANDNYHNLSEDLDLMKDLGLNMYRFQVSWSRVMHDGDGNLNSKGLEFYDQLVQGLLDRGIEPMICLYHFDMPLKLANEGGFLNKKVVDDFIRFGKIIIDHFKDKVKYWITFNEQNLYFQPGATHYAVGIDLGRKETIEDIYQISHNIMYAHACLANYLHDTSNNKIGGMLAYAATYPSTCNPSDQLLVARFNEFVNNSLLDAFVRGSYSPSVISFVKRYHLHLDIEKDELAEIKKMKSDFIAFSYYRTDVIDASKVPVDCAPNYYLKYGKTRNKYTRSNYWDWNIDPQGFRKVMDDIYYRYRVPVFPIENGIGLLEHWDGLHQIDDQLRIDYMREHINELKKAQKEDGVEVLGYLGWGLIDILSSSGNMDKRYGVVYVNRSNHDLKDMKRIPKKSFYWLQNVIKTDAKFI